MGRLCVFPCPLLLTAVPVSGFNCLNSLRTRVAEPSAMGLVPRWMLRWGAEGWEGVTGVWLAPKQPFLPQSLPAGGHGAACHRWLDSLCDHSQMLQLRW